MAVRIDPDKDRLLKIPPSGDELPDDSLAKICWSTWHNHLKQGMQNVKSACATGKCEPLTFCCLKMVSCWKICSYTPKPPLLRSLMKVLKKKKDDIIGDLFLDCRVLQGTSVSISIHWHLWVFLSSIILSACLVWGIVAHRSLSCYYITVVNFLGDSYYSSAFSDTKPQLPINW